MPKRKKNSDKQQPSMREELEPIIMKANTSVRRTGKVVRTFHCQKVVRKLKQLKEEREKGDKKVQETEQKLEEMKNFNLDKLVFVTFQRLGLLQYMEQLEEDEKQDKPNNDIINNNNKRNAKKGTRETVMNSVEEIKSELASLTPFEKNFVETMLQHKRLSECMEAINESITSYRNIQIRREEWKKDPRGRKRRRKDAERAKNQEDEDGEQQQNQPPPQSYDDYTGTSGLFIGSLSGKAMENEEYGYDEEGNNYDYETSYNEYEEGLGGPSQNKRKNRKGQRARKAKALAIQARTEGRTWDKSMNWRPKKENKDEGETNENIIKEPIKASDVAETGKDWKEDGTAHPSWLAAQKKKKEGIVAFAGKKITFD